MLESFLHHPATLGSQSLNPRWKLAVFLVLVLAALPSTLTAQTTNAADSGTYPSKVLKPEQWQAVDRSIERGLRWLATQQQRDGSFPTLPTGQPAVTSLCTMAFMAGGNVPGEGVYGQQLKKSIDFVLSTQLENGLFSQVPPRVPVTSWNQATHTAMYNHAIAGLMLSEAYGMNPGVDLARYTAAIEKGLALTLKKQRRPGPYPEEDGGWRYYELLHLYYQGEADLSVTGWHMMFLRSATNAGFDVPKEPMQAALKYVEKCFEPNTGQFSYGLLKEDRRNRGRGMTGAGIMSLAMAGKHHTDMAQHAGQWLLNNPVDKYNSACGGLDRFSYGVHYASHGMYQLDGKYWEGFYPIMVQTFLDAQLESGAWPPDAESEAMFGNAYTTALAILSLTPPYQMLPIYQR